MRKKKMENEYKTIDNKPLQTPRQYGQMGEHRLEKILLLISLAVIIAIVILLGVFLENGYLIVMVVFLIVLCSLPMLFFVIRIPYNAVIECHLTEDNLIDSVGVHYIPLHLIKEYDIVGNMPPLRTIDGTTVYIADYFNPDKKIIHMSFDERFSNLRYMVHKKTFLETKNELKMYAERNLRRILIEDVTILGMVERMAVKFNDALFKEPEKYIRVGTLEKGKEHTILGDEQEIIKRLQDKDTKNLRESGQSDRTYTDKETEG